MLVRAYLSPDTGGAAGGGVAAPAAPGTLSPSAPPTPPPSTSAAPPSSASVTQPQEVPADSVVQLEDGSFVALSDLIAARGRALDPESFEKWKALEAVSSGKADAATLAKLFGGGAEPAAPVDPNEKIAHLERQLAEVNEKLGRVTPTYEQLDQLRQEADLKSFAKANAEKLPYLVHALTKMPDAGADLARSVHQAFEFARTATGLSREQMTEQQRREIVSQVIVRAENRLKSMAEIYGGRVSAPAAAPGAPGAPINDQVLDGPAPGTRLVAAPGGIFVDEKGNQYAPAPGGGYRRLAPVSSYIPSTSAPGGMVAPDAPPAATGPMTMDRLRAGIRAKIDAGRIGG